MFRLVFNLLSAFGMVGVVAYFALLVALVVGYVANIWQVAVFALSSPSWEQVQPDVVLWVAKLVGLFFGPLGAVMGWYGMF